MPKLSDENNTSPLSGDLQMYYRGTYVCREVPGDTEVMYVESVQGVGDDSKLKNIVITGNTRGKGGEIGRVNWTADEVLAFLPPSGFYKLPAGVKYVSFQVNNRSQKKGLQHNQVVIDGLRSEINLRAAYTLFNNTPFDGLFSKDLCLVKGELRWKTFKIGTLHDGNLTILKQFDYLQELVCKLLARCLEIKSTTIQ